MYVGDRAQGPPWETMGQECLEEMRAQGATLEDWGQECLEVMRAHRAPLEDSLTSMSGGDEDTGGHPGELADIVSGGDEGTVATLESSGH